MVGRFKGLELEVAGTPRDGCHDGRAHTGAGRADGSCQPGRRLPLLVPVRDDPGVAADPDAIARLVQLLYLGPQHADVDMGAGG